jgi:hypothetical protein
MSTDPYIYIYIYMPYINIPLIGPSFPQVYSSQMSKDYKTDYKEKE